MGLLTRVLLERPLLEPKNKESLEPQPINVHDPKEK